MAKSQKFEESFGKLEELISQMESGNISLEESFKLYNEGIKLIKNCNSQLDKVEKQIVVLNTSATDNNDKENIIFNDVVLNDTVSDDNGED